MSIVLHVASPFQSVQPADENEVIGPAVDGTLRILRTAKASGSVRRVVVTSSAVAISYGVTYEAGKVFTKKDWSDAAGKKRPITAYGKSKTLAEKAAWDFIEREGGDMELAVVNPVGLFGPPLLLPNESTTCGIIQQMLQGSLPALPHIELGVVDEETSHLCISWPLPSQKRQRNATFV